MRIYLAAPWFSPQQELIHNTVLGVIKDSDHTVYAPREECALPPDATKKERVKVFADNLQAIGNAELIVCITDYKDTGTIWEAGYAFRAMKPILYYAETLKDRPFNLMLAESGIGVTRSAKELRFVLSAKTIEQVQKMATQWKGHIE